MMGDGLHIMGMQMKRGGNRKMDAGNDHGSATIGLAIDLEVTGSSSVS